MRSHSPQWLRAWTAVAGGTLCLLLMPFICAEPTSVDNAAAAKPEPTKIAPDAPPLLSSFEKAARTPVWGPDDVVDQFVVQSVDLPTAVKMLSNKYHVLCGIEVIPWRAEARDLWPPPLVSLTVSDVPVRYIMNHLVMQDPRFVWFEDHGVINLVMQRAAAAKDYPLAAVIPEFEVADLPYMSVFLPMDPRVPAKPAALFDRPEIAPHLGVGTAYSGFWEEPPRVSIKRHNQTVRGIINEVARRLKISWSMEYESHLSKVPLRVPRAWFYMQAKFPIPNLSECPRCVPWNSTRLLSLRESTAGPSLHSTWNAKTQTAVVQRGPSSVTLQAGVRIAKLDGKEVWLATPPVLNDGELLVPEYFVWGLGILGRR